MDWTQDENFPPSKTSQRVEQQKLQLPSSDQQNPSDFDSIFMLLEDNIITFVKSELNKIQTFLSLDYSECSVFEGEEQKSSRKAFIKICVDFLRRMKQDELAEDLQSKLLAVTFQCKLKSSLKEKFQCVFEAISNAGNPILQNQIYVTEGGTAGVNDQHEVRQIEAAAREPETLIGPENLFKLPSNKYKPIRTVMTKGVAGIGKTVLTQKFTLDWVEDKIHQDIKFMFPLTFRELNVLKEQRFSLVELIHHFFTETKEAGICSFENLKVLFILDGLDECRLPLDFQNNNYLTNSAKATSVAVLLTNLIRGNLLPSACLWITTRPSAANRIPSECVGMVTEIRGFNDPQKEQYFKKMIKDKNTSSRIIYHIKTTRSLRIMCNIPVFCWITGTVLNNELKTSETRELPCTLTEMYIHFLLIQTKVKKMKYDGGAETSSHWSPESRKIVEMLAKLAFDQLEKGNLIFYESDLLECGIDLDTASIYSAVFPNIFKEERGLYQEKVFSFIHLSAHEFLAALHVHLAFFDSGINLMEEKQKSSKMYTMRKKPSLTQVYQSAVDKVLKTPNGHLDLFLCFFLGLSLQTNQSFLRGLIKQTGDTSKPNRETVKYIMKLISEHVSAERSINLFHCLTELNHSSLVEEIQQSLKSGSLSTDELSSSQWSALIFILLTSGDALEVFDLKNFSPSEKVFMKLLPIIKVSHKAQVGVCGLSERSCEALSPILCSPFSSLKILDLSNNDLQDSGVGKLSVGLQSPNCKLDSLSLSGCLITNIGCASLASALTSNSSHLKELDLTYNHPGDSGMKLLIEALKDPKKLRVEPAGEQWLRPGSLRKYSCQLVVNMNSVSRRLKLSDNNRKVTLDEEDQSYHDHPDRFDDWCPQLLCENVLTGRCYWEVKWGGEVNVSVSYREIRRKKDFTDCLYGRNDQSWSLRCSDNSGYSVRHDNRETLISSSISNRVAVYVDVPAESLSFYTVSSDSLVHLHTFNTTFTKPLYAGIGLWSLSGSISSSWVSLAPA